MNERERREYYDEVWKLAGLPSEEDLLQSPAGVATLELLKNSKPVGDDNGIPDSISPEPPATEAQVANASPPEPAVEPVNPYLQKISWPPKGSLLNQPPKDSADEQRNSIWPRYTAGRPSALDTSLKPLAAEDFDANKPI